MSLLAVKALYAGRSSFAARGTDAVRAARLARRARLAQAYFPMAARRAELVSIGVCPPIGYPAALIPFFCVFAQPRIDPAASAPHQHLMGTCSSTTWAHARASCGNRAIPKSISSRGGRKKAADGRDTAADPQALVACRGGRRLGPCFHRPQPRIRDVLVVRAAASWRYRLVESKVPVSDFAHEL